MNDGIKLYFAYYTHHREELFEMARWSVVPRVGEVIDFTEYEFPQGTQCEVVEIKHVAGINEHHVTVYVEWL